jgi:glutamine amidotransferase
MVGIVDYGMGNIRSVFNAVEMSGGNVEICGSPEELADKDRIILPGVGAFKDCSAALRELGFAEALNRLVLSERKPILGICLGMQVMARKSYEGGEFDGLGWFEAEVVKIKPEDPALKVPQIGWNNITKKDHPLFEGLPESPDFYFVHSFHANCEKPDDIVAVCDYGMTITAAIAKDNIFASQFHPEKSQDYGLRIIENFLEWNP